MELYVQSTKRKKGQLRILYLAKLSFKNEGADRQAGIMVQGFKPLLGTPFSHIKAQA